MFSKIVNDLWKMWKCITLTFWEKKNENSLVGENKSSLYEWVTKKKRKKSVFQKKLASVTEHIFNTAM